MICPENLDDWLHASRVLETAMVDQFVEATHDLYSVSAFTKWCKEHGS